MSAFPELAVATALCSAGPFRAGDHVSIAFVDPALGRVEPHDVRPPAAGACDSACVPEFVSVRLANDAGPYRREQVLTLSFVDPRFARIAAFAHAEPVPDPPNDRAITPLGAIERPPEPERAPLEAVTSHAAPFAALLAPPAGTAHALEVTDTDNTRRSESTGVCVALDWTRDRAQRFVAVVDKLFTSDRLGWYRHVFAMRLLLPDRLITSDEAANECAADAIARLRAAAVATLGRPLLAAFMPNFTVTAAWLETLDPVELAPATESLRAVVAAADAHAGIRIDALPTSAAIGWLEPDALRDAAGRNPGAVLPFFIAPYAHVDHLSECAAGYRTTLIEAFAQLGDAPEAVRLRGMSEANRALDERLWRLAGAVNEAFVTGEIA